MRFVLTLLLLASSSVFAATATLTDRTWNLGSDLVLCSDQTTFVADLADCPVIATSAARLAFTDLISGPDTGLGDGVGSGAIVTVWGWGLGSTQGTSTVEFVDNATTVHTAPVYYWKNADGALPGGPANLYASHKMQEVAFSIPDSATGTGTIRLRINGEVTNTMPFTVRSGNIYHVKASGNDSSGDGSWANPWATAGASDSKLSEGDILYLGSVTEQTATGASQRYMYFNQLGAGTEALQTAVVSYPNERPIGRAYSEGVTTYNSAGVVVSKLRIETGNHEWNGTLPSDDLGTLKGQSRKCFAINGSNNGRIVANYMTNLAGHGPNSYQGAIVSGAGGSSSEINTRSSNLKVFGNHIQEWGVPRTDKFAHTTYFSIRNDGAFNPLPIEIAFNYLKDNQGRHGIHIYDEHIGPAPNPVGHFDGTVDIHHNVVVGQRDNGINIGAGSDDDTVPTNWRVFGNLVINAGAPPLFNHSPSTSNVFQTAAGIALSPNIMTGTYTVAHNTVYEWGENGDEGNLGGMKFGIAFVDGGGTTVTGIMKNNAMYTSNSRGFFGTNTNGAGAADNMSGDSNAYYNDGGTTTAPSFDADALTSDPQMTLTGDQISVSGSSPLIGHGDGVVSGLPYTFDIYGQPISGDVAGAVQP